jgi:hypothetical protein
MTRRDEEGEFGFITDISSGEIITAITLGESTYWEGGMQLIEQREGRGRTL